MNRNTFARLAVLLLAAVSLALSGCGGDDGVDQSVHDMVAAERDAAAMARDAAQAALADAQTAADAAAAEAARTLEAAQMALTAAETAQTAAESARDEARTGEADAETRAMAAEAAATQAAADAKTAADAATQAAADLKAAQEALAAAMTAQMDAEMERDDAQEMVQMNMDAEVATRAATLHPAMNIINHAGVDNTRNATGQGDGDFIDEPDPTPAVPQLTADVMPGFVAVGAGAPKAVGGLGLTHSAAAGTSVRAVDAVGLPLTGYTAADDMAPAIEGWDGLVLSRGTAADDAMQTLYAYTDIASAPGETFVQKYGAQLTLNMLTVDMDNLGLAASGSFPSAAQPARTFNATSSFAGTFDGVPGMFSCAGAATNDCTLTPDATGELTLGGTGDAPSFTFTPTDANTVIGAVNSDYLYFGYWLHKPHAPGGTHDFSLFSGGSDMFNVYSTGDDPRTTAVEAATAQYSRVHALSGRAVYSGPAAGKYVTRNLTAGTADIGIFTATVGLAANFDAQDTSVAASDTPGTPGDAIDTDHAEGMVAGAIHTFMANGESLGNWHITLNGAGLGAIGMPAPDAMRPGLTAGGESTTQFTGSATARVGAASAPGSWVGVFYGNDRVDGNPESIAGAFEVNAPHAAIAGAFGAYNQAE